VAGRHKTIRDLNQQHKIDTRSFISYSRNTWVIESFTGVTNFSIGVKGDVGRYGHNISSAEDTTNVGMTNYPTTYYYDTSIIFTAKDGDFTGGAIRLSVQYFKPKGS